MHRTETGVDGFGSKNGPTAFRFAEVDFSDRFSPGKGVEAWTLVVLKLEQFQQSRPVAGCGHNPELVFVIDQENACCGREVEVNAAIGEEGEKVDYVEVVDQRVGELHKCAYKKVFSFYRCHCSTTPTSTLHFELAAGSVIVEAKSSRDDVTGYIRDRAIGSESMCPNPHSGLGNRDL
jgi:hypothetical protein